MHASASHRMDVARPGRPGASAPAAAVLAGLLALGTLTGRATAQEPLLIPHTTSAVALDGRFTEPAWAEALALPMTGYAPVFGAPPSESTVVRIVHDGRAIYVAASAYDRDPAGIQAHSRARDEDHGGDFVNVILDTFGDSENAVVFSTTPVGARLDYAVANDAEGPEPSNISWNGFWDVRVRRDDTGWFAEFRIPFSTLRFQPRDGVVRMGLIVNRRIGRKSERVIFPAVEPRWAFGMFKPSRARAVAFAGVETHRQRILVPYVLGGSERLPGPPGTGGPAPSGTELRHDVGGDLKMALADNVNVDVTINTDFAEAAVDDQRIDLGRYAIADPERRQFFLERAGVFDFALAGDNRLLHTRRIGLTGEGQRVPIAGGVRLVGRVGGLDVGLLDMQTRGAHGQSSANLGALRLRQRLFNGESFVGAMLTSAISSRDAAAAGLDATVRVGGAYFVRAAAAAVDAGSAPAGDAWSRAGLHAQVERRTTIGLGGAAGVLHLGSGFQPPVGFVASPGVRRLEGRLSYGLLAAGANRLRLITPTLRAFRTVDLAADTLQTRAIELETAVEMRSGATLGVAVERRREVTLTELQLAEGFIAPPGTYDGTVVTASASTPPSGSRSASLRASRGGFFGGRRTTAAAAATWHPLAALTLTADYLHERLEPGAGPATTLRVARLRAALAATARHAAAATLQHSTAAHLTRFNLRWRINFREGNDLWLVYDHALNGSRARTTPALPRTAARSVLVKFTYAVSN